MSSTQVYEILKMIRYPDLREFNPESFEWLFDRKENNTFMNWFCNAFDENNVLTPEEVEKYEALVAAGIVNEGDFHDLSTEIPEEIDKQSKFDSLEDEIHRLEMNKIERETEALGFLKTNLGCNNNADDLTNRIEAAQQVHKTSKAKAQLALEEFTSINQEVNNVVNELKRIGSRFQDGFKEIESENSPKRLAHSFMAEMLTKQERYNKLLKQYLQMQFPTDLPPESIDKSTPASYTKTPEQEQLHEEAKILHDVFVKAYNEWVTESVLDAQEIIKKETLKSTQKLLEEGSKGKLHMVHKTLEEVNEKVSSVKETVQSLISKLAEATVGALLTDVYERKCARMAYFLEKLDKVIEQLVYQKSYSEMYSHLCSFEHDLLMTIDDNMQGVSKSVEHTTEGFQSRMMAMENLKASKNASFENEVQIYLEKLAASKRSTEEQPKLIKGRFGFDIQNFISKVESENSEMNENVKANFKDELKRLKETNDDLNDLQSIIWKDAPSFIVAPPLSPKAVTDFNTKLSKQLNASQNSLEDVINEYKKKSEDE